MILKTKNKYIDIDKIIAVEIIKEDPLDIIMVFGTFVMTAKAEEAEAVMRAYKQTIVSYLYDENLKRIKGGK